MDCFREKICRNECSSVLWRYEQHIVEHVLHGRDEKKQKGIDFDWHPVVFDTDLQDCLGLVAERSLDPESHEVYLRFGNNQCMLKAMLIVKDEK